MADDLDVMLPAPASAQPSTLKILKFAHAYLETGNGTESARRAGYQGSDINLARLARKLLERDDVGMYVARHLASLISPEEVGSILSEIARGSIEHFLQINDDGSISWDFSTPQAQSNLRLIKSIKQTAHGLHVTIHDPLPALALIAKYTSPVDSRTMQRQSVERFLAQLPPETRNYVRDQVANADVPVIEGKPVIIPEDLDLSFLNPGVLPVDDRPDVEVDAEDDLHEEFSDA